MTAIATGWQDYQLIDTGDKEKLEKWGEFVLVRPDPQALWLKHDDRRWAKADAIYHRASSGGGRWQTNRALPPFWTVSYHGLTFKVAPTNFKHTGLFPEQAVNWDWMMDKIKNAGRPVSVLNLFAYTGAATMACAKAGAANIVHVDAAKGMVSWAKENMELCGLQDKSIHYIVDDVTKFVARQQRRGTKYSAIIMDPPSYGRGPNNELWKLEDQLTDLISQCAVLLEDEPLFFLINAYTTGFSPLVLANIMHQQLDSHFPKGKLDCQELALPQTDGPFLLPCGLFGRYEN